MSAPFLPYAKQSIQDLDIQAVTDALKGEIITRGPHVEAFEQAIAHYCGASYAVAFNSGTSALMGAYFAAKVSAADRLISTPNTFVASVGAAIHFGAYPHFVDIDRQTGNLNLNCLQEKLDFRSTRGRLIICPIHFSGIPVDMQELDNIIRHRDAVIIEDAAHALGSSYSNGQKVGSCSWSHMTMFSFHPAKTITTGEGGMILTNDPELYHRLRLYRNNGIEQEKPYLEKDPAPGYYEVQVITSNFHFTDFQAALGLSQFQRLDQVVAKRRHLVQLYRKKLQNIPFLKLFIDIFDEQTAFHLFVIQIDFKAYETTREKVMLGLREKGIGTQVHYIPIYHHPFFQRKKGDISLEFPEMEAYYEQALSLPLYEDLTEQDIDRVCAELKSILKF
jgi:UDP-4-amino-4,6-dideoxy-L-N-acetyl-beta-L-altrosamine transaminase